MLNRVKSYMQVNYGSEIQRANTLLFLSFINDLPTYMENIDITMFTDDTTMANILVLNMSKSFIVEFQLGNKKDISP